MAPLHLAAGSGALRALSMLLEAGPATGLGLGLGLGLGVGLVGLRHGLDSTG